MTFSLYTLQAVQQVDAQYIFGNKWLFNWLNLITLLQAVSENLHVHEL